MNDSLDGMPQTLEEAMSPQHHAYMRVMAMAGRDLGFSTLEATEMNGLLAGIFATRAGHHEGKTPEAKAEEYRAAFEKGLRFSLANTDNINAVFAAPH